MSQGKLIWEIQGAGTCDFLRYHIFSELTLIHQLCQLHTGWELISALLLLSKSYQFF